MNNYSKRKEEVRDLAINWQAECGEKNYSWSELADWGDFFTRLGRRYGLLREFRENGIV